MRTENIDSLKCYQVFDTMYIMSDGTVSMCTCDNLHPHIIIGNVVENNPISIFNNKRMKEIREIHLSGNKNTIEICRNCNMLYSRKKKEVF